MSYTGKNMASVFLPMRQIFFSIFLRRWKIMFFPLAGATFTQR